MIVRRPRFSKEEAHRRGTEIYDRDIRAQVETDNRGKYVAIDIETGAWEMDAEEMAAGNMLYARYPDAQTWMMRVGYRSIRRFGAGRSRRGVCLVVVEASNAHCAS
ncbi:MAG: hypothetical protein M3Y56_01800 [Armatimonadota bacterium]|nr:hypothetical protein [Armatimonadota bacterium]